MKQFLAIIALAVLFVNCKADDESCKRPSVHDYLDEILEKARDELPDPIRLPPRSSFVELSDGVLWGLDNITRLGDAEIECIDENSILVKAKVTTDELKGRYTWQKERRNKSPREGYVVFISHDFEAEVDTLIEKKNGQITHPVLQRFEINRFKDAKVEITGMGFFTWALGEMTTLFSGVFQRAIGHAVQGPLQEALQRQMREIDIECAKDYDFSKLCNA
ncbi:uncharacterized protein TNIN_145171 [Trichonephila inaurata madagascariensis]|uniref:Secreted protein n=1 Tax=Trichonephila inaurata madagascariensis TaxID=2747483 RepID=A0A8X6XYC8_9ARAC|nr:uncharacterized protein TNIN_145171 [Trichonephila inaurata madagascariensis]